MFVTLKLCCGSFIFLSFYEHFVESRTDQAHVSIGLGPLEECTFD